MSDNKKWIGAEKPFTVRSKLGQKIRFPPSLFASAKPPGCYKFNDGTTQNWNLDQLYVYDSANIASYKKITPFTHPITGQFYGFVLMNSQKLALAASVTLLVYTSPPKTDLCDIYLESPDLSTNPNWQDIAGYSIDIYRTIDSPCGGTTDPKGNPRFFAQLQLRVIDTSDNKPYTFSEWNAKTKDFDFHIIKLLTPYNFVWKPSFLSDPKYKVKQVRVRLTMPNILIPPGSGECALSGKWLIGNVCPEK